jgi:hypothetical protein
MDDPNDDYPNDREVLAALRPECLRWVAFIIPDYVLQVLGARGLIDFGGGNIWKMYRRKTYRVAGDSQSAENGRRHEREARP